MILGHADRSAILSCLRVNKRYHTLAFRYIGTVYNHVFIDRDTIDSVFEGICWEKVEKRWTAIRRGEYDRETSDLTESDEEDSEDEGEEGRDGLDVGKKNTRPISILLDDSAELDNPLSFDSSSVLEKSNRRMTLESLADGPPQLFGHDHQGQHDRKRYSLSNVEYSRSVTKISPTVFGRTDFIRISSYTMVGPIASFPQSIPSEPFHRISLRPESRESTCVYLRKVAAPLCWRCRLQKLSIEIPCPATAVSLD
jgi:hypothetical protein